MLCYPCEKQCADCPLPSSLPATTLSCSRKGSGKGKSHADTVGMVIVIGESDLCNGSPWATPRPEAEWLSLAAPGASRWGGARRSPRRQPSLGPQLGPRETPKRCHQVSEVIGRDADGENHMEGETLPCSIETKESASLNLIAVPTGPPTAAGQRGPSQLLVHCTSTNLRKKPSPVCYSRGRVLP